jgi:acyl carrier protein
MKLDSNLNSSNILPVLPVQNSEIKIDQEKVQDWLISTLAKELDFNEEIDIYEPLANYGLSSMTAVGLAGDLEDWLDIKLPATLAWDYPSIEAISKFISDEVN